MIELDDITQIAAAADSKAELTAAFRADLTARLKEAAAATANAGEQDGGEGALLLCGVSRIGSEWGEVSVVPPGLTTGDAECSADRGRDGNRGSHKLWLDIAPHPEPAYPEELAATVAELQREYIGGNLDGSNSCDVEHEHRALPPPQLVDLAELVESARRAVLRDLRDTPDHAAWLAVAEEWAGESRFYAHMAARSPGDTPAPVTAEEYELLVFGRKGGADRAPGNSEGGPQGCYEVAARLQENPLPELANWV
eukprot:SAG31_NODE_6971_length_1831_cov_1.136836_1_plen_253_part_10